MNRRKAFQSLLGVPALIAAPVAAETIPDFDPTNTDHYAWADHFIAHVKQHPTIPTDRDCLATWFASAIVAGRDDQVRRVQREHNSIECSGQYAGALSYERAWIPGTERRSEFKSSGEIYRVWSEYRQLKQAASRSTHGITTPTLATEGRFPALERIT